MLRRLALTAFLSGLIAVPVNAIALPLWLAWGWPAWLIGMLGLAVYALVFAWTVRAEAKRRREGYHLAA